MSINQGAAKEVGKGVRSFFIFGHFLVVPVTFSFFARLLLPNSFCSMVNQTSPTRLGCSLGDWVSSSRRCAEDNVGGATTLYKRIIVELN